MGEGGPDQSLVVFGIRDDGGLTPPLSSVAHGGGPGPNAERQERSHAHSVNETVGGGIVDRRRPRSRPPGDLSPRRLPARSSRSRSSRCAPGAGPRHVALHPDGRFAVRHERARFDHRLAVLRSRDQANSPRSTRCRRCRPRRATTTTAPTSRSRRTAVSSTAPIAGTTASRSSRSIRRRGALSLVDYAPCGGSTPRNLALTPSGSLLLSANQNGDGITIFARDAETGRLEGHRQGDRDRHADVRAGGEGRLRRQSSRRASSSR